MVEITVKALDSASAMEEVEKRLGADALIVSTNKVDGQIQIVATNDEPSNYTAKSKPLVLDANYKVKGFQDILETKIPNNKGILREDPNKVISQEISESAEKIKNELNNLVAISADIPNFSLNTANSFDAFKMAGFKASIFNSLGLTSELTPKMIAKVISKNFIHGKCSHFEETKLHLVTGSSLSGKTLFSQKLKALLEKKNEIKSCKIFPGENFHKSFSQLTKWISSSRIDGEKHNQVGIVEIANSDATEGIMLELRKHYPQMKLSVINLMPVGKSYEFLTRNLLPRKLDNEYLALTKLDNCDLSMQEINAFIELNHKCMFFSGTTSVKEGLFYSKMEETISHILQSIDIREE